MLFKDDYYLKLSLACWSGICFAMALVPLFRPANYVRFISYILAGLVGLIVRALAKKETSENQMDHYAATIDKKASKNPIIVEKFQIYASSFIGSFFLVRGLSVHLGGYMPEFRITFFKHAEEEGFSIMHIVYVLVIIATTMGTARLQESTV